MCTQAKGRLSGPDIEQAGGHGVAGPAGADSSEAEGRYRGLYENKMNPFAQVTPVQPEK